MILQAIKFYSYSLWRRRLRRACARNNHARSARCRTQIQARRFPAQRGECQKSHFKWPNTLRNTFGKFLWANFTRTKRYYSLTSILTSRKIPAWSFSVKFGERRVIVTSGSDFFCRNQRYLPRILTCWKWVTIGPLWWRSVDMGSCSYNKLSQLFIIFFDLTSFLP